MKIGCAAGGRSGGLAAQGAPRDLVIVVLGRALQAAHSLVTVRLVTELLGPTEVGRMNLIAGATTLFAMMLISPASSFLARRAVEWNRAGRLLRAVRGFAVFLLLVVGLALALLALVQLTAGIGVSISLAWLLWVVGGNLLFASLSSALTTLLNTLGFRLEYVGINLCSWLGLGAAILLTRAGGVRAELWLTGLLCGQMAATLMALAVLRRVAVPAVTGSGAGEGNPFAAQAVLAFSGPLLLCNALYWVQTNGYRLILVRVVDAATVGLFTTGMAIAASPLVMLETLCTEYYRPVFYHDIAFSDTAGKARAWNRYAAAYLPAVVIAVTLVAFGGPYLAFLLVSEAFQSVSWLTLWGGLTQGALMVYGAYVSLAFATLNTRALIRPNAYGALTVACGILLLAPWQPLLGPALALALGMAVTACSTARALRRDAPVRLPWRRLGEAALLAAPLAAGLLALRSVWPATGTVQAAAALALAGAYALAAEYILARRWLHARGPTGHELPVAEPGGETV